MDCLYKFGFYSRRSDIKYIRLVCLRGLLNELGSVYRTEFLILEDSLALCLSPESSIFTLLPVSGLVDFGHLCCFVDVVCEPDYRINMLAFLEAHRDTVSDSKMLHSPVEYDQGLWL